jgi:hypothetical protein
MQVVRSVQSRVRVIISEATTRTVSQKPDWRYFFRHVQAKTLPEAGGRDVKGQGMGARPAWLAASWLAPGSAYPG